MSLGLSGSPSQKCAETLPLGKVQTYYEYIQKLYETILYIYACACNYVEHVVYVTHEMDVMHVMYVMYECYVHVLCM